MLKIGDYVEILQATSYSGKFSMNGFGEIIRNSLGPENLQVRILGGKLQKAHFVCLHLPKERLAKISKEEYEIRCVLEDFS